MKREIMV